MSTIPLPWAGDQLYRPRPDWGGGGWTLRDYNVPPPQILPPAPPFKAYVPPAEQFAFSELPRDPSRYQALQAPFFNPPIPPAAPPTVGVNLPQQNARPDWTLRDYAALQDQFSALAVPLRPPVVGSSLPQMQPWANWTLRDYAIFQDRLSSLLYVTTQVYVPAPDVFAFGELPRDMTAQKITLTNFVQPVFPPRVFVPTPDVIAFGELPRDMSALRLILSMQNIAAAFSGIPQVPIGSIFVGLDYEPIDMTPYELVFRQMTPPAPPPRIPPSVIPFIEWPGWVSGNYQQIQDQFSGLFTPAPGTYPPGLLPQFTPEAMLRTLWPYQLPQTFRVPPPPPRVVPTPHTFLEWRNWHLGEYPGYQDAFSAWISGQPIPAGFRCMAVTAGLYGGLFYNPGDVFDILFAHEYSDSTKNYEFNGGIWAVGWMLRVPQNTPLFQAAVAQEFFIVPDPNRRFIL